MQPPTRDGVQAVFVRLSPGASAPEAWFRARGGPAIRALLDRGLLVKGHGRSNSVSIRGMDAALSPSSPRISTGGRGARAMEAAAPPERDQGKAAMEKILWEAADQFRANSGLKAQGFLQQGAPLQGTAQLLGLCQQFIVKRHGGADGSTLNWHEFKHRLMTCWMQRRSLDSSTSSC